VVIREIQAKNILSKSQIYDYTVNPYGGCTHACAYCYARFMKRFSGYAEPWGKYVDVKINAVELLRKNLAKARRGRVWISGVCDAYQPAERKYRLTRGCLEVLLERGWPVTIQTKSPLVLWDIALLKNKPDVEVGMSVATADETIRKTFEPGAPPISERIKALEALHEAGIKTFAMIAPLLPGAVPLPDLLAGKVDRITIDRINYGYADWLYKKYHLEETKSERYFLEKSGEIETRCAELRIECRVI
jgi:DNA repair photolyase